MPARTKAPNGDALRRELGFLSDPELAAVMRIELGTLKNRRSRGDAPPSSKIGANHVTKIADLEKWIASRRRHL